MDLLTISIALLVIILVGIGYLIKEIIEIKKSLGSASTEKINLQLQAYERLAVFAERSGLKNLISRASSFGESAAGLHAQLIDTLKTEYEYNVSQQIYVSREVWDAVTKLKDQNIYILNQLGGGLPPQATALDMSKRILEYSLGTNSELNLIVLDAIQHEAKKLLQKPLS